MRKLFISILLIIIVWISITFIFSPPEYLFPKISSVFKELFKNLDVYSENLLYTLTEIILGFLMANIIGLLLAFISLNNRFVEELITTISIIVKTIPIIAIAPLLILWFGHGLGSKIAAVTISSFIPILINTLTKSKETIDSYKNLILLYRLKKIDRIKYFILPSLPKYLVASFKISISLSIVGALVSEFISANKGLGYLIISNYYSMNIAGVFVCIAISGIIGIISHYICNLIEQKYNF